MDTLGKFGALKRLLLCLCNHNLTYNACYAWTNFYNLIDKFLTGKLLNDCLLYMYIHLSSAEKCFFQNVSPFVISNLYFNSSPLKKSQNLISVMTFRSSKFWWKSYLLEFSYNRSQLTQTPKGNKILHFTRTIIFILNYNNSTFQSKQQNTVHCDSS